MSISAYVDETEGEVFTVVHYPADVHFALVCLVDWNRDGFFDGAFEDITGSVTHVNVDRGVSPAFGTKAPSAQCNVDVQDPQYAMWGGAIPEAWVAPGAPLVLIAATGGQSIPVFRGIITDVQYRVGEDEIGRVTLVAQDHVGAILGGRTVRLPAVLNTTSSSVLNDILASAGVTNRAVSVDNDPIPIWFGGERKMSEWIQLFTEGLGYTWYVARDGQVRIYGRTLPAQAPWDLSGAIRDLEWRATRDAQVNAVRIEGRVYRVDPEAVLWSSGEQIVLAASASTVVEASWDDPAYNLRTPVAGTDYRAVDAGGVDRTSSVSVSHLGPSSNRVGLLLQNNHTASVTFTLLQVRGEPIRVASQFAATQENPELIAMWGRREREIKSQLVQSLNLANTVAQSYAQRKFRSPQYVNASLPRRNNFLAAEILDSVTLSVGGRSMSGRIVGIRLDMDAIGFEGEWTIELQ